MPFGIVEKHGPHLPLGTDLLDVRFAVMNAVKQEYAVVFPEYYFGQIFEARQQPGTLAYSLSTQLTLLQETVERDGAQRLQEGRHRQRPRRQRIAAAPLRAIPACLPARLRGLCLRPAGLRTSPAGRRCKSPFDMHAGEVETSNMLIARPDLVHQDRAAQQSGADQHRQNRCPARSTPASGGMRASPITMQATAAAATKELGEFDQKEWSRQIAEAIKAIKADDASLKLQNQFFEDAKHPLDTKQ